MKAIFVELSPFSKYRENYLGDDEYRDLQQKLMDNPAAGDVIKGTGGLRVIYYYWVDGLQFWMFTVYDKDEMNDLSRDERKVLSKILTDELLERSLR